MLVFGIGFSCGIAAVVAWMRLRSKPAPWWKARRPNRIKLDDLKHDESGDSLLPVDALRIAR